MLGFLEVSKEQKVSQFFEAAGKKQWKDDGVYDASHEKNLKEECNELRDAIWDYCLNPSEENRANLCKEWADVQVVLSGIAWWLDIPASAAFNRVHKNNMTKVVDGKVRLRADGKILKPEGYVKADMRGL